MRIAFLFSGQGAQYPGMLQDLYQEEQVVRDVFDKADKALGRSISDLCFHGTQEDLNLTHNTQPCVLAADLAVGKLLRSKGVVAEAVAGFSLGEYAALTFAGAIKQDDVFPIVQVRADAMQEAVPAGQGEMAALIGKESNQAAEICEMVKSGYVIPANYGTSVFSFSISDVPQAITDYLRLTETTVADYNAFLFHQANQFIIKQLIRKMKLPKDQVPLSLDRYGNTGGISIPLTLCDAYGDKSREKLKALICGFGIGLSWGVANMVGRILLQLLR